MPGRLTVSNTIGDAAALHAAPENHSATFQVASQFNCLEFVGPQVVPEDGVTGYRNDRTQGPACSIACGPATVFRNYFAPVASAEASSTPIQEGQTRDRMINNLADMSAILGNDPEGRMFSVQGGYTMATDEQLAALNARLMELDEADAIDTVREAL